MTNDVMTTKKAAELWGKSPNSIKQLCTEGKGGHRLYGSLLPDPLRLIRQLHMGGANAILRR